MTNVSRTPGTAAIRQIRAISLKTDASRSWALYWVRSHCPADLSAVEDYIGQRDEMQCHAVLKSTAIVIQLVIQRTRGCFFCERVFATEEPSYLSQTTRPKSLGLPDICIQTYLFTKWNRDACNYCPYLPTITQNWKFSVLMGFYGGCQRLTISLL